MKKIKNILEVIITLLFFFIILKFTEILFTPNHSYECLNAVKSFYKIPKNSVDVIVLGSSHAWKGVNTLEMYEKYGIGAYNYSGNWQRISTEKLFFYDALERQKPKVVLLETYRINEVVSDEDMDGEIFYTREIKDSKYKKEYLKQAFGDNKERYLSYNFPYIQFHSNWYDPSGTNLEDINLKYNYVESMGYYNLGNEIKQRISLSNPSSYPQYELQEDSKKELDDIVKTCKEKNIELILFTIPWEKDNYYSDALIKYAKEKNIKYLDLNWLNSEIGLDGYLDYYDDHHLNDSGAIKVADYLGKYIKDNYEIKDRRKEKNNLWQGKKKKLEKEIKEKEQKEKISD